MARKLKVDLVSAIRRLEVTTKNLVTTMFVGRYKTVFKGRGLDFSEFREYNRDADDASMIDWKSSARAHKLLIKVFEEERNLDVFFLVDVSSSMIFGSTDKLKNEYAAELVASLAYVILKGGDSVGLALFSEDIVISYPPTKERNKFYILTKALVDPKYYGGGKDFSNALRFTFNYLPKNSIVFIISDFFGLKGDWERFLKAVSKKLDTIAIMVNDPRDYILPEEAKEILIEDPFSKKRLLIDSSLIKEEYERHNITRKEKIKQIFSKENVGFIEVSTDKPFIAPIIEFFIRRAKRYA